jgi:hypothetical protein
MEAYQERVIEEVNQLQLKINKLADFLNSDKYDSIDDPDVLLEEQFTHMSEYRRVLNERIKTFSHDNTK